ncbi:MAG TPA: transposase [Candidatus Acidoferrales bacterium]|nr:transposase [Candidatus Acidoferrales bacterium]
MPLATDSATPHFRRKNIRLPAAEYRGCRTYFVTLACERRFRAFATAPFAQRTTEILGDVSARHAMVVHAYCVMPDHLHLLIAGLSASSNLLNFVMNFKQMTTAEFHSGHPERSLWQKKFYDHVLRFKDKADGVAAYIWMNPVRKGLCRLPGEYPWSGSFSRNWKEEVRTMTVWEPPWKTVQPSRKPVRATVV